MKIELDKKLCEKYPKLFRQRNLPMNVTAMCWGFDCSDHWYGLIDNMCRDIQAYIDKTGTDQVEFIQIKEKFGTLRAYTNYHDDNIEKIIEKADAESAITCERCGSTKATQNEKGWISTLCLKCREEKNTR